MEDRELDFNRIHYYNHIVLLSMKNKFGSVGKVAPTLFILSGPSVVGKDTIAK
jgi:hypothetical protein